MGNSVESCVKKIIKGHESDGKCWHNKGLVVYTFSGEKPRYPYGDIDKFLRPVINSKNPKDAIQNIIGLHEQFNVGMLEGHNLPPYNSFDVNASKPGCLQTTNLCFCHTIYAFFKYPLIGKKISELITGGNRHSFTEANRIEVNGNDYVVMKKSSDSPEIYFDFIDSESEQYNTFRYEYFPCRDL